jgi:SAM-dependent methyltransferase
VTRVSQGSHLALCCPTCQGPLLPRFGLLACRACDRVWPIRDGIASFGHDEILRADDPREQLRALAEHAAEHGWREAIHGHFPHQGLDHYWGIFDPLRADWFYPGDVGARGSAVDLAAGWGGGAIRLARLFDEVVAVEGVWERARFLAALSASEGLVNVRPLHADVAALPLPSESFDLAVMQDRFEYLPRRSPASDPEAAQRQLLGQAWRLLRPGGSFCLGVSNRFSFGHLLGKRDHGRPRWAGVLPRFLAKLYSRFCHELPGPALTHSPSGYRRLLESAGFTDVRVYAAFPSHHQPRVLVPLSDPGKLAWAARLSLARRAWKLGRLARVAHRLAAHPTLASLLCRFSSSLVIWARRPARPALATAKPAPAGLLATLQERLATQWEELGIAQPYRAPLSLVQLSGTWERGGKVNWFVFAGDPARAAVVAKVARAPEEAARVVHEHHTLTWLRALGPGIADHVPRPLALWEIEGHAVALQEYVPWQTAARSRVRGGGEARVMKSLTLLLPFLTDLARQTRHELPRLADHPYLGDVVDRAFSAADNRAYAPSIRELLWHLALIAEKGPALPCTVAHHGDVSLGDILAEGAHFCLLDWESAEPQGLPFVDLVSVAISAAAMSGEEAIRQTMRALVGQPGAERTPFSPITSLALGYCAALGLDESTRGPLAAAGLLNWILRTPECRLAELILTLPSTTDAMLVAAQALTEQSGLGPREGSGRRPRIAAA